MKPLFAISLGFLFCCRFASAQTERSIEIIVQDTLHLVPDHIEYLVVINSNPMPLPYLQTPVDESTYEQPLPKDELLSLAHQHEGKVQRMEPPPNYTINNQYSANANEILIFQFQSIKKVEQFYHDIKLYSNIGGAVTNATSSTTRDMKERLLTRIIRKAKAEADQLAKAINKKAGEIIRITEIQPDLGENNGSVSSNTTWVSYAGLGALGVSRNQTADHSSFVIYNKAFRITFALQ